jgi:hypothetical protein
MPGKVTPCQVVPFEQNQVEAKQPKPGSRLTSVIPKAIKELNGSNKCRKIGMN